MEQHFKVLAMDDHNLQYYLQTTSNTCINFSSVNTETAGQAIANKKIDKNIHKAS